MEDHISNNAIFEHVKTSRLTMNYFAVYIYTELPERNALGHSVSLESLYSDV